MKKSALLLLSTALIGAAAAPAFAAYDKIGTISVDYNRDRDAVSPNFGGPVEALQFVARGSDIQCKFIRATFNNGHSQVVFSGRLLQNQARNVDLPGNARNIARLSTNCRAFRAGGARIDIAADIGSYRDTWRRSPDWSRTWAKMFNWAKSVGNTWDRDVNYWVPVTTVHFSGGFDRDATAGGWSTSSITKIGLKPSNSDARCRKIIVAFRNGQRVDLGGRDTMRKGQTEAIDLPGGDRDVSKLVLTCRAVGQRAVDIQVFGRK